MVSLVTPARRAAGEERRRAIVLPVELDGYWPKRAEWRRDITLALVERLRGARFSVPEATLPPGATGCRGEGCLVEAATALSANVAVAARIINDQQRLTSYHLWVLVVERTLGGTVAPVARTREKTCVNCTELQARDMLVTLMSAALASEPIASAPKRPRETMLVPAPRVALATSRERKQRFTRREQWVFRGLSLALAVGTVAGIAQGLVEMHHDGDAIDQMGSPNCAPCDYRLDTSTWQAVAFSLGAASLAVGGVMALLGWWPFKSAVVSPQFSATGGNINVGVTF